MKVYALSCVANEVSISMGSAIATQDGKERNAVCGMMSVKCLIAMDMDTAIMENALVSMASKANFVTKLIALTPTVLVMVTAHLKEVACANVAGKVLIALLLTVMPCSVSQTALDMELLIWRLRPALAKECGLGMTALRNYVTRIVDLMVIVWVTAVYVTQGGQVNTVCLNSAIRGVMNMGSVRMEPVFVSRAGMENIAQWKAAQKAVVAMGNVE